VVDTAGASSGVVSATLNWLLLARAVVSYVVTIVAYVRLQRSDPGYLNADMLNELGDGHNSRGEKLKKQKKKQPSTTYQRNELTNEWWQSRVQLYHRHHRQHHLRCFQKPA
jgi:hypothetical protein